MDVPTFARGSLTQYDLVHSDTMTFNDKIANFTPQEQEELKQFRRTVKKRVSDKYMINVFNFLSNLFLFAGG